MTAIGALIGLLLAIVLVVCKNNPTYSLILGALVGGLCGGLSLLETVDAMQVGVKDITPAIIRILTAGVLTGVLIKTGAAASIAYNIISALGSKLALFAVALSTMVLGSVGVFIDVAVITVAPVALAVARRLDVPKMTVLLAMIGGGKCGNIISPNPNTIIAAENFQSNLFSVMGFNLLPAVVGLLFVIFVVNLVPKSGERVTGDITFPVEKDGNLPSFLTSIIAPV